MPYHQSENGEAVMIKIDVPVPLREEPRYPKEKWKTFLCKYRRKCCLIYNNVIIIMFFLAFVLLASNMILATVSLSIVHERLPDREIYKPLPDVVLDNIAPIDWALDVSEILIMIQVNSCILLVTFHKHR